MTEYDPNQVFDGLATLQRANEHTAWRSGYCLEFVANMFAPHGFVSDHVGTYANAAIAREHTPYERRYNGTPPAGSVCYFTNGNRPGHIAISAGNGYVRSTDKLYAGQVATVSIDDIVHSWGGRPFAFWSDWLMGHSIQNLAYNHPSPAPAAAPAASGEQPTIRLGSTGPAVTLLQETLNRDYPLYSHLVVDGDFGPATLGVVREFQARDRITVDGVVGPQTWKALGL